MELRNVRTFLCVAEQKNFSKAADLLGYAQSTVTTQIQQLEQEFDTLLFERFYKSIRLTESGEKFLGYAKQLLKVAEDTRISLKGLPEESGELRIAMADSLCTAFFSDILEQYHNQYPQVELRLTTAGTDDLFRMLQYNEVDLVYTLDKRIFSPELITAAEQKTEVLFVVAPSHPAADKILTLEELTRQKCLLTEKGMSYREDLDQVLAANALVLTPFLELGNVEMLRTFVERGLGISFLPEFTVNKSIAAGKLQKVGLADHTFCVWRQLIYHKNKWVTPKMQAMITMIREMNI